MAEIVAIWIKRSAGGLMDRVDEAQLVAGRGVAGSADQGGWRQITVIDESAWRDAARHRQVQAERVADGVDAHADQQLVGVAPGQGKEFFGRSIDLQNSRGRRLQLGESVINIRGENPPCRLMNEMQKPLRPHWRAGVFGEIEQGGTIRVGDSVSLQL